VSARLALAAFAMAAVAIVVLAGGCGGDSRRDAVVAYIDDANAIQRELVVPLVAARHVYTELSRGDLELADARPRLTKAAQTIETLEHRVEKLEPPPEAKRLHALLLQYLRAQAGLANEVELLAEFTPRFEQRLGALRVAERRLRTALAAASTTESQAAAIDGYGRDVGSVLETLRPLDPPAPMAAAYETEVDMLANVQRAAAALAKALRNGDAKALPARILQLAKATRASQNTAAQRSNIAALKLYNERIGKLSKIADAIRVERARLQQAVE
jgi:hypothetical protein